MEKWSESAVQAIRDSIAHHEKMEGWTAGQPAGEKANIHVMKAKLGESWSTEDCALCVKFGMGSLCHRCPLSIVGNKCISDKGSPYMAINDALTWGEWHTAATQKMLPALKALLDRPEAQVVVKFQVHDTVKDISIKVPVPVEVMNREWSVYKGGSGTVYLTCNRDYIVGIGPEGKLLRVKQYNSRGLQLDGEGRIIEMEDK